MEKDSVSLGLMHEVEIALKKCGADSKNFWKKLVRDEELAKRLVDSAYNNRYEVKVDYNKSLLDMIRAGGYYHKTNFKNAPEIPTNDFRKMEELFYRYRVGGGEKVIIHLFNWQDKNLPYNEIAIRMGMTKKGCRPANINEMMALGEQYPNLYYRFCVVAPGSIWESAYSDIIEIPLFHSSTAENRKTLQIKQYNISGNENYFFAGVEKNSIVILT